MPRTRSAQRSWFLARRQSGRRAPSTQKEHEARRSPSLRDWLSSAHYLVRRVTSKLAVKWRLLRESRHEYRMHNNLAATIDAAWEQRAELAPASAPAAMRDAVASVIADLDAGRLRVAEKIGGDWVTHQWIKKAVLLSFRLADNMGIGLPGRRCRFASTTRCRPSSRSIPTPISRRRACAWCRRPSRGAARSSRRNVVLMPSYVNIGAYVDEGTMVDTWATVGSCAQIGKNVHLSGGVGIGGVLEPLQANPTIIEDNCFIGARSEVVEGVIVEENSVLGMGVFIGQSTKIYDRATGASHVWPRAGGFGGRRGQPALRATRRLPALLRGDREAGRRQDALEDQHQRTAADVSSQGRPESELRRSAQREAWNRRRCRSISNRRRTSRACASPGGSRPSCSTT